MKEESIESSANGDSSMEKSTLEAEESGELPSEEAREQLRSEAEENYDKYLRAVAELENYKKRALKERSELLKYAGEHIVRDLLEVIDNLERAARSKSATTGDDIQKGIELIFQQLVSLLERHSIRPESALGATFNPEKHQAISSVPTTEHEPGIVIEELRKAYFFKDRLLRPAQVVVAVAPAEASVNGTGGSVE